VITALNLQGERETPGREISGRETSSVDREPNTAGNAHSIRNLSAQRVTKISATDLAFQSLTSEALPDGEEGVLELSLQNESADPLAIDLAILLSV